MAPAGRKRVGAALVVAGALLAAGCSHRPVPPRPRSSAPGPVVVASFNFPESELVAEIYAQALEHVGVPVRRELDLGTREMVLPALHGGLVDVVPEYVGSALAALEPGLAGGQATGDQRARLAESLRPWNVEVLAAAPAQDQNGLVVTRALAERLGLRSTSDLAAVAPRLSLGGPAECPTRPFCLVGFGALYGIHFGHFQPYDVESQRVTALEQQVVDVAVMFTTDGQLATGKFVLLADDRHLQPAENLVPLLSARAHRAYGDRVPTAINAVSSALSTNDLVFLNWRVGVAGKDLPTEARGWLERHGLVPPA